MAKQSKNQIVSNKKLEFFKFDLKNKELQKSFNQIYEDKKGNWSAIKPKLTPKNGYDPVLVDKLEFTQSLSTWTNDNLALVSLFQKNKDTNSMRDIALKLNKETFIKKVTEAAPKLTKDEKHVFGVNLYNKLFHLEPTPILINQLKDPKIPFFNDTIGANISTVLEKKPNFNIRTTTIYEVLNEEDALKDIPAKSHKEVVGQLKILQCIAAVSPVPDSIPVLYNSNLHNAFQISEIPQLQFHALLKGKGLDDGTIKQIHKNAQNTRVRNEHALMAIKEAGKETGVAMIDKSLGSGSGSKLVLRKANAQEKTSSTSLQVQRTLEKHNLSWDLLFGDADFCECSECTSVYSAASYFVELLQYLRNNNLDPLADGTIKIKPDLKDIDGTPVKKLFDRRPDLKCLELTCQNTKTILPYVDLVNEVMESYVAFKELKPFNVDDEVSSELLAEPQHTEYKAYCILKHAVYPFTLPYHQPIDAARIYLKFLDTSRHEIICRFKKNNLSDDPELTELKDKSINRAYDAEFLGLTKEEYIILTKECFESKALIDKIMNKTHTESEYRELIGVKPVYEYYGYDDEASMLGDSGLALIKKEFLRRTGIDYITLVDLLKTEYINPCIPKGKSLTIMESLRFSYRFLQNYARANGIEKMAADLVKPENLAELYPKVKELIESLTGKESVCPGSKEDKLEITDKDIIHWVKCHFECVGKMIVIESGVGCVDGEILSDVDSGSIKISAKPTLTVSNCILEDTKENKVGDIDKKSGKITFTAAAKKIYPQKLVKMVFAGKKGEHGIFITIEDEIYLIFPEQKDSCNLDSALLQHLDGTALTVEEYDRIHRFIRLWRKIGWTIDETDKSVVGLCNAKTEENATAENISETSICIEDNKDECNDEECGENYCKHNYDINPELIHQLAAIMELIDKTGLDLIKLLTFWTDISIAGENSLYKRLFLKHNVLGIDKVFKADANGNYLTVDAKISEHLPVIMAALNLSADEIVAIKKASSMEDKLTIGNLSVLYKYRLLSKVLGLKIQDFINIIPLFKNVFNDANTTLKFMKRWARMEDAGFTHQQLNFIVRDFDDEKKPFTPSDKTVLLLAKTLYDGLNAIDIDHQNIKADDIITDLALREQNIKDKVTSSLIRTKASLLFDTLTVDKIISLLEGTSVYVTYAPTGLTYTLTDDKTLSKKLKYNALQGAIQITGILTDSETNEFKALSNNPEWLESLIRIEKQRRKLFKEILSGIFDAEKTISDTEKSQLKKEIQSGDVTIALDQLADGQEDTNTAPKKRLAFMKIFFPYLRQELTHRFIVSTLSNYSGLENKVTDLLISEILKLKTTSETLYSIFEKIKESIQLPVNNWKGYLIPPTQDIYTFILKGIDTEFVITLGGEKLSFTIQEDSEKEWWSSTIELKAGELYNFTSTGVEIKSLFWKTITSSISPVPSSALIPDFTSEKCKPALIALKKASILISNFELSSDEIKYFDDHKSDFDNIDFNAFTLEHWLRLEAYTRLRNSLPESNLNILDFWKWINDKTSKENELIKQISKLTTWKEERVKKLIDANHFNIGKLIDYLDEKNLLKLQKALNVADKIGMDIDLLFDWAIPATGFKKCREIADSIKNAIRARYNQTDWEEVIKPLYDQLRNNQRDALTAYILQKKELIDWGVKDADGLFEYFLIDVQMDACMPTSRIKQAISSVQLFIQRCFLGLEEEHNHIKPDVLDRDRWDWMQRYRVWEANRKIFLYPENWIESNLRDDKSPFFKELESELLQKDINKQNVTDALKSYLYKVDEVSNMEVVGLYLDENKVIVSTPDGEQEKWPEGAKLHVFSRTRNAPYFFYYRYLALDEMNWYPWEKMQVDIPSYDYTYERPISFHKSFVSKLNDKDKKFVMVYLESANDDPERFYFKKNKPEPEKIADLKSILKTENLLTEEVHDNGCYLTPVAWNERLLIFFPQIMKKTRPAPKKTRPTVGANGSHDASIRELSDNTPEELKPIEYYEIKMAWSEYRNRKWTQKQLSTNVLSIDIDKGRKIDQFSFIPMISDSSIFIYVKDQVKHDTSTFKGFTFTGSMFENDGDTSDGLNTLPSSIKSEFGITSFQKVSNNIQSLQLQNNVWGNDDATFTIGSNVVLFTYPNESISSLKFYYADAPNLLNKINLDRLEEFFMHNLNIALDDFGPFDQDDNTATKNIYHELKRPYSLYNWELFFHTPIMLADALSKAQHFEESMKWFHFVFNPIADGTDDKRFWQFLPFKEIDSQRILDSIFNNLQPNTKDDSINEWRKKPFMPHVVARNRPVAYMKWVVMKYIDNMLSWGDYLFRQDTIESINEATQLYVLAGHILGPRPMMIPKRGKIKPQTYMTLLDKWDAFGNAMVELELVVPFSNQISSATGTVNDEIAFANIFGLASSLYFCIPNNPKLMGYWDLIEDRLYKIRHCENIEGIFRKLPLFEPPIDPALLVKAAAQGLSIASVLNDLNTPMPNYRFYYLLQKALELCNELKSLGGAMLSAIEKKDNETVALIRAKHENVMQEMMMEIKKKQLEEAQKNIESLQQNRKAPEARMKYYLKLSGLEENIVPNDTTEFNGIPNDIVTVDGDSGLKLIPFEKEDMDKAAEAQDKQVAAALPEKIASILHALPTLTIATLPFGVGGSVAWGSPNLASAGQAWAKFLQLDASELSYASTSAGKKGSFTRALQERIFQANSAGFELKQIDKQITAQQIRVEIANLEISNQQKSIDNAQEVEEFIKNKYSNEELYTWMRGNLSTLYHQVYSLAYELAKKAEKVYRFERGLSDSNFIQAGYWDAGRDGLLAGEQLYVGLKQLEAAYQNERGYDYEISKQISLRQINPLALIQLREKSKCEFSLPEVLFDMDYPGHFKRRIKSISISIPCVVGPYTGINATLQLLENEFRNTAIGGKKYEKNLEESDERFSTYNIPIKSIAASTGQNDSGVFELNFKDERYLPFEGAGVISKWRLELPSEFKQFDYNTISDVILHVRYSSNEGGERLKNAANKALLTYVKSVEELSRDEGLFLVLDLKHDCSNDWPKIANKNQTPGNRKITLDKISEWLPVFTNSFKVTATDIIIVTSVKIVADKILLNDISFGAGNLVDINSYVLPDQSLKIDKWAIEIDKDEPALEDCWMVVRYTLKK